MTTIEHIWSILTSGVTGAIAAWVAQNFFVERLRLAVAHDYALKLESHKAEIQRDMTRQLDLVRADFEERGRLHRERWQIKRDACLAALRIVDSVLTNIPWENSTRPGTHLRVKSLPVEAQEARDAMNRLILSCDRSEVVLLFLKAVGLTESGETAAGVDTNTVQELRNAIRRELGFGNEFTFPSALSWVISIHGDHAIDEATRTEGRELPLDEA